jgi:cell growth-regulating nucleolar protein
MSEAQKYQGALYKEKKKGPKPKQNNAPVDNSQALVPRNAYVEDEADNRVAIVDAPPRAPSPPPGFNVFDFLVDNGSTVDPPESPPPEDNSRLLDDREYESSSDSSEDEMDTEPTDPAQDAFDEAREYMKHELLKQGFGYERFDPNTQLPMSPAEPSFVTPAPYRGHSRNISNVSLDSATKESNKKRKRGHPDALDLSSTHFATNGDVDMTDITPVLHSGLTGGLNRLLPRPELPPSPPDMDSMDASSPHSPIKRTKHSRESENQRGRTKEKEKEKKKTSDKDKIKTKEEKAAKEKKKASRLQGELVKSGGQWVRRRPRKDSSNAEVPIEKATETPAKRKQKQIEYQPMDASGDEATGNDTALIIHPDKMLNHAEMFMSLVTKGPESEKGCSINKALKRYHRERGSKSAEAEKDLWKILRMKRNDRGEVVLFVEGRNI